jgi:thiol-disulfide isomerase/thioredoxin
MAALPDCPASCNETFKLVADRIATRYASEPQLARSMFLLQSSPLEHSLTLLRQMGDQVDNRTVRGMSLVALAIGLHCRQDEDPDHNREATQVLERVIAELADVPFEGSTLGELVEPMMYELKHLSEGSRAMEITGLDAEGKEFRLSDYRGQVVVLDFWADWCPHCVAMYPMERELVQRHAGKPFALLGVNCDQRPRLQRVLESKAVTWRNWADGPQGAIARQWRIEGFPTVYVIDHEGVIRYKNVRGPELERAVDTLLSKVPNSMP